MDATEVIVANSLNWINWVFFGVLVMLCVCKVIAPKQFSYFIKILSFDNYLGVFGRSSQPVFNRFNGCFFVIRQIVFTVFLYMAFLLLESTQPPAKYLWYALLFFVIYWSIRFLLEYLIALASSTQKLFNKIQFLRISIRNLTALILLVLLIIIVYIPYFKIQLLYFTILLYGIAQLAITGVVIYSNRILIRLSYFYFILYLCTFEIIPLLVLIKVFIEGKTIIL